MVGACKRVSGRGFRRFGDSPEKDEEDYHNGENQGGSWRGWAAGKEDVPWVEELEMRWRHGGLEAAAA